MNAIPKALRLELASDPYYKRCARAGLHQHECAGRITWEHALYFQGKQVQARYSILPLCAKAHGVDQFLDGGDLDKNINEWIALNRATAKELAGLSRARDYRRYREYLNGRFGPYTEPQLEAAILY